MARSPGKGDARYRRAARRGWADQLAYEGVQKQQRDSMKARMDSQRRARQGAATQAYVRAKKRHAANSGVNAGTLGGSRRR